MSTTPTIWVPIGLPGSGKSTWRDQLIAQSARAVAVLSSDDHIEELAKEAGTTYTEIFPKVDIKAIEGQMRERLETAIKAGEDIVVDRTNLTHKSRRRWLSGVPKGYRRVAVVMQVEEEELERRLGTRAAQTGKDIPRSVIENMRATYEPPLPGEFDEVIEITG